MFDQINGLPVHALVLHAAVIFVPLLAVGAVVYALVPRWRPKLGWAVVLLAVAAPASAFVAKASGTELYNRLLDQGMSGRGKEILDDHMGFGTLTAWFALALGVVSIVLVALTWRRAGGRLPMIGEVGAAVVLIVLAALSGYYVFKTGDSGATAVWGTY
ncbi:hypothetical protein Aab01nite_24500 [Paractinoplanes abujensis]|uniref:DUF2231 domain-containing protein n=1 Tax=Paractinoplanes abujensis TaxID=882441 RepID=A0A7W7CXX6_9ACTN|nr:DUF2231 domain-containing protein [Actinoplanes abujensis]MBB4696676.1 hypothetical protein [Actinoplanes abujensis]GID18860.1 hypothetical protein Aab01nite_24500 [Actinoplanes abujensis]